MNTFIKLIVAFFVFATLLSGDLFAQGTSASSSTTATAIDETETVDRGEEKTIGGVRIDNSLGASTIIVKMIRVNGDPVIRCIYVDGRLSDPARGGAIEIELISNPNSPIIHIGGSETGKINVIGSDADIFVNGDNKEIDVVGDGVDVQLDAGRGRDIDLTVTGNANGNPPTGGDDAEVQTTGNTSSCSFSFAGGNSSVTPTSQVPPEDRFSWRPCR